MVLREVVKCGLETAETKSTEEYLSWRRNTRLVKQGADRQWGERETGLYLKEYAIDGRLKFSVQDCGFCCTDTRRMCCCPHETK